MTIEAELSGHLPSPSPDLFLPLFLLYLSDQKYVNVVFGSGSSHPALQNGRHYYVCIHAIADTLHYEKWSENLTDVRGCSDGVTVDLTSPEGGNVWVDGLLGGIYQVTAQAFFVVVVVVSDVINTYLIPSGIMLLQLLLLLLLGVDSVLLCSNLVVIFKLTQSLCVADLPQGAVVQMEWFH